MSKRNFKGSLMNQTAPETQIKKGKVLNQAVLETELRDYFVKTMNKDFVGKKDIVNISMRFQQLKTVDPKNYMAAAKKAGELIKIFKDRSLKGKINPKEFKALGLLSKRVFVKKETIDA